MSEVTVTQEDRETAASALDYGLTGLTWEKLTASHVGPDRQWQADRVAQAFARHRAAAHAAGLAEGVALGIEAAARVGEHGRNYWRDKCEATKARRESRDYGTMAIACVHVEHAVRALNPAAIMAAHTRAKAIGTVGDRDGDDGA